MVVVVVVVNVHPKRWANAPGDQTKGLPPACWVLAQQWHVRCGVGWGWRGAVLKVGVGREEPWAKRGSGGGGGWGQQPSK